MNDRVDRAAQAVRMAAGLAGRVFDRLALTLAPDRRTPPARALSWLRGAQSPSGGILTHGGHDTAYQEVSGYLIPTFLEAGSRDVARRLFEWLTSVQRGDGAFTDPDAGRPHLFDTAQVVRGLLCFGDEARARDAVRRACEFIESRMIDGGRGGFLPQYAGGIPETVLLYALRPLRDAAHLLERPEWDAASRACLEHYEKQELDARRGELSHFLGYECEAFIEMGRADVARPVLERLATEQKEDGSLRGSAGAEWVCTPGLAQMAICWYRIGLDGPAGRAMTWLDGRVERGGEMRGSHGTGASYFPDVSIPWAHKFYLDAHRLRVESFFRRNAASFPESIGGDDGRVEVLRSGIASGDRVLDAGCGKGRFLRALRDAVPGAAFHGVDISGEMLRAVPAGIETRTGAIENLPYEDATFDVTFSVEAIEHAIDPEAAVGEMIRVTRPGGRVIVVEKQAAHAGSLKTQPWEMWPTGEAMPRWLGSGCDEVEARPVGYDGHPPDGLMMAWSGRRRSRLTGLQWNSVLVQDSERERMLERLRRGVTSPWGRAMSLATAPGDRVLEIGSGTGEISLRLALGGRRVTLLDVSRESLEFAQRCAAACDVAIEIVCADATAPLPFDEGRFDCVWSSGLLEHFHAPQRREMLAQWARACRGSMVSIVPNASSLAYQAGKRLMELEGAWPYGLEMPLSSLREDYEAAGLRVTSEVSVGSAHSLEFLPAGHPLREAIEAWIAVDGTDTLDSWGQGYLLVTAGERRS